MVSGTILQRFQRSKYQPIDIPVSKGVSHRAVKIDNLCDCYNTNTKRYTLWQNILQRKNGKLVVPPSESEIFRWTPVRAFWLQTA